MDIPDTIITTILAGVGVGFKVLWNRITRHADKCEADRDDLRAQTDALSAKVRDLEDRMGDCSVIDCPIRQKPVFPRVPENAHRIPLQPRQLPPPQHP